MTCSDGSHDAWVDHVLGPADVWGYRDHERDGCPTCRPNLTRNNDAGFCETGRFLVLRARRQHAETPRA